jgi:hypothetical protein
MTALVVTRESLRVVKNDLIIGFPDVKSSHLTEALAFALGFRTSAALQARLAEIGNGDPDILLLEDSRFYNRLDAFEYQIEPDELVFFHLQDDKSILDTTPISSFDIEYTAPKSLAWRNLMVSAINAGILQKLFAVKEDDNRWPGFDVNDPHNSPAFEYDFTIAGMPARAEVRDNSYGELAIHAAVRPTGKFLGSGPILKPLAGAAEAAGWLERRSGAWLMSAVDQFASRGGLIEQLASLDVKPLGYGDRGRVIN